jgi:ABC-2 type transport system permease protein
VGSLTRVRISVAMTARALLRSRVALLLLFVVPTLFVALVALITSHRRIAVELPSAGVGALLELSQRQQGLVFVGLAAVGVLTAFLALDLLQRDAEATRRLVLCGYRPREVIAARLTVLVAIVMVIASYVAVLIQLVFRPAHPAAMWLGFLLGGWVYGCYGVLVGALVRRELEGILLVVLLANIDVGWVQNPIYYADAQVKSVIRSLPAHFPSQVSMLAAFTDHPVGAPALRAFAYGAVLLAVALVLFHRRMQPGRR